MSLLDIRNLRVTFATRSGAFTAVDGIDLAVDQREVLAVVGESGSGKSVAMLAVMGLLPWTATVTADRMAFDGRDLRGLGAKARRGIVGRDMAMIFQEPMSSLNPCFTVGFQIREMLKAHTKLDRAGRRRRAAELLTLVGIPEPERRLSAFPASAFRRHEPARDDRHGDLLPAEAADRRRAHDRPRRDYPGADSGASLVAAAGNRGRAGPHHPRHGRRGRDGGPRPRTICGPRGRSQRHHGALRRPPPSLYGGAIGGVAGAGARAPPPGDPRRRPGPVRPSAGLRFRAAVLLPVRSLPSGQAGPCLRRTRPRPLPHPAGRGPATPPRFETAGAAA